MFGALKYGFQSLATLKLVMNSCRQRTLNLKEQLRHRAVSLRQHGFLVLLLCGHPVWFYSCTTQLVITPGCFCLRIYVSFCFVNLLLYIDILLYITFIFVDVGIASVLTNNLRHYHSCCGCKDDHQRAATNAECVWLVVLSKSLIMA